MRHNFLKKMSTRLTKNEKGQSAIEFAMILPLLLIIVILIIDTGWIAVTRLQVTQATQESAKFYAYYEDLPPGYLSGVARMMINTVEDKGQIRVTSAKNEGAIEVTVKAPILSATGFTSKLLEGKSFSHTVVMRSFHLDTGP